MPKKIKYLVGFAIVAAAFVYLMTTTFQSSLQYYVTVSEMNADLPKYSKKTLKVAGRASHIQKEEGTDKLTYRFDVDEGGQTVKVVYQGLTPDTFKDGSDVVVTGKIVGEEFIATEILAKCASKYEVKTETP